MARRGNHRTLNVLTLAVRVVGHRHLDAIDFIGVGVLRIGTIFRNRRYSRSRILLTSDFTIGNRLDILEFLRRYGNRIKFQLHGKRLGNIGCGILDRHLDIILLVVHINSTIVLCRFFNNGVNVFCFNIFTTCRNSHNRSCRAINDHYRSRTRSILSRILIRLGNRIYTQMERIAARTRLSIGSPFNIYDRHIHINRIRLEINRVLRFNTSYNDFRLFVDILHLDHNLLGRCQSFIVLIGYANRNHIYRIRFIVNRLQENGIAIRSNKDDITLVCIFINVVTEIRVLSIRIVLIRLD